ncbi:hypothetical protein ZHAS_00016653 [Anopheles sinensis]|uniref:Uncharacterized protein n=1 Tax=Anopheles sinensis TaxID=74873 RepID=A0A084WEL4_ANOSI|nr:hypothetical protein ZHAS_00016653 [Anopheles sinensis]
MSRLNKWLSWVFLVCVAAVVRGTMPQVIQLGNRFKLEDVSDDNLKQVLDSIGPMRSVVQELDLSGNALKNFNPEDLAGFESLQILDLSSNFITGVVNLSSLSSIQHLDLSNNFVSEVFVGLSIESLLAPNNRITKVTCIGGAPKKIILANNRLSALSDLTSTCRSGIFNIDLSLNEITIVDFSELLQSRDTLSSLNLEYNFIVDVRNSENYTFPALELLDVSSNKLVYLGEAFQAAENVRKFDASFNEIVLISHMLLFNGNLSQLDLRGNRFDCDTLRKFFRKNEFLYQLSAPGLTRESCANGPDYVGPYCCEPMPIPFVDQLIEAKRKKVSWDSHRKIS